MRAGFKIRSFTIIPGTPLTAAIEFQGAEIHAGYHIGHGARGHKPDQTWNDPAKAMKMAEMLFNELKALALSCGGGCPAATWDSIKSKVQNFVDFEAETYTQWYGPVPVANATFTGYNQKIQLLDPKFSLDPNKYRRVFAK